MSLDVNHFDDANIKNYLMEINAKLREISETISVATSLDILQDYKNQFYGIQRELYFFYGEYSKLVQNSRAGRSSNYELNEDFENYESIEKQIYLSLWQIYRQIINQRTTPQYHDFLAIGDIIAQSFFSEFLKNKKFKDIKPGYFTYSKPLTFMGSYSRYDYYTIVPEALNQHNMDIPIISVSRSASGTLWSLLAVSHEVGHDIMGNIQYFESEASQLVLDTFQNINYSMNDIVMPIYDPQSRMLVDRTFSPSEMIQTIWTAYLSESFADVMGIIFSGPAFLLSALGLLGGSKKDQWQAVYQKPEEHPPGYLRGYIQTEYLKKLGFNSEVQEINDIFEYVSDMDDSILWESDYSSSSTNTHFEIDLDIMEDSASKFIDALLGKKFTSLGDNKISDIVTPFTKKDQAIVVELTERLQTGDSDIENLSVPYSVSNAPPKSLPKHILSASQWSVIEHPKKSEVIRDTATKMFLKNKSKFLGD